MGASDASISRASHGASAFGRAALTALTALALLGGANAAEAGGRFGFQGMFGLGGEFQFENSDDDARATPGFGIFYEHETFEYLHLGIGANFLWFNSRAGDLAGFDRSMYIDIAPFAKVRYGALFGDRGEVYVKVPLGVSIAVPSSDLSNQGWNTGAGLVAGVLPGFSFKFLPFLSAHIEMGWMGHFTWHSNDFQSDDKAFLNQFQLNFGAAYHF